MDLFNIIYIVVPFVIIYMLLGWEIEYYERHIKRVKYISPRGRRYAYSIMFLMAVLAILVAVPFIVLAGLPHP